MSKILIAVCALMILVVTPSVHADPITITSGFISVTGLGGGPDYSLIGENFSATGSGEKGFAAPQTCFPCVSGDQLGVASTFSGTSLGMGTVVINGMTFEDVFISGTIQTAGFPITIPAALTNISIEGQFDFMGTMFACEVPHLFCTPANAVFSTQLVGHGIVTVQLNFLQLDGSGNSLYVFQNVTYRFQSAEIPEPLTIILLTTGLLGLSAKLKVGSN